MLNLKQEHSIENTQYSSIKKNGNKLQFTLPKPYKDNQSVQSYLKSRGVDAEIIDFCIDNWLLYESKEYHNAVFVGRDMNGIARYAFLRGTVPNSAFRIDAPASDKRFSFCLAVNANSQKLYVFEGAIDLLSHITLYKMSGLNWQDHHRLSLGGIAVIDPTKPPVADKQLPIALEAYLSRYPHIREIVLCMDNDIPGRKAAAEIKSALVQTGYVVNNSPPPTGKDYNDYLQTYLHQRVRAEHKEKCR